MRPDVEPSRWLTATGWNWLHPIRLAFEGVASLALATAAIAVIWVWSGKAPVPVLILGFALLWILGALGACRLHRLFRDRVTAVQGRNSPKAADQQSAAG
jgi:hypothetical protein